MLWEKEETLFLTRRNGARKSLTAACTRTFIERYFRDVNIDSGGEREDAKRIEYNDRGCLNMFAVKSAFGCGWGYANDVWFTRNCVRVNGTYFSSPRQRVILPLQALGERQRKREERERDTIDLTDISYYSSKRYLLRFIALYNNNDTTTTMPRVSVDNGIQSE